MESHKRACEKCITDCTKCKLECLVHGQLECVKFCEICILACNLCLTVCSLHPSPQMHAAAMKACHAACHDCYEECKKHSAKHCKACATTCLRCVNLFKSKKTRKH